MTDKVFVGTLVLPDRIIGNGYVLVADGVVRRAGEGPAPAGERYGGTGFLVLPGAIDGQVHSRSQMGQEDFVWSTRSAASGGVATIVDMPYDDNALIASAGRFRAKAESAGRQARVDFALYATVDPAEGAARVNELVDAGAAAFKFSTFETHPRRFPRVPPRTLHAAFRAVGQRGLVAGIHNENDEMVRAFMGEVEDGRTVVESNAILLYLAEGRRFCRTTGSCEPRSRAGCSSIRPICCARWRCPVSTI